MERVVITGGTGFVGRKLVEALGAEGHEVTVLSRRPGAAPPGASRVAAYSPLEPGGFGHHLEGASVVVNLAGEQAVGVRYTEGRKASIRSSRVEGTRQLVEAMRQAKVPPRLLLSCSGIGIYGTAISDEPIDERGEAANDFLAQVCVEWEEAARAAEEFGVRVVVMRLGVVLGREGGALPKLVKPFQVFAGGVVGSGQQYLSWIHSRDLMRFVSEALVQADVTGTYNLTAPHPVTYRELNRRLSQQLRKPGWFQVPSGALRLAFGEGAEAMLGGRPVLPRRLSERGFVWKFPELAAALADLLA